MSAWHEASAVWTCWDPRRGSEGRRKAGWSFQGSLRLSLPYTFPNPGGEIPATPVQPIASTAAPANMDKCCFHSSLGENLFLHHAKYSKLIEDKTVLFLPD